MNENRAPDWRHTVERFAEQLALEPGSHAVKDLCRFLLGESTWSDEEQVVRYLRDYRDVSRARLGFHERWASLTNMANLAIYDRQEIEQVSALIGRLDRP